VHPILKLLVQRTALGLVLLLRVSAVIFLGVEALPGDPAHAILGQQATPEALANQREQMGLNEPPLTRYLSWLGGILSGDLGTALTNGADIGQWTSRANVMTRTGEICERTRDEMVFSYRESSLDELVILDAAFELEEDDPEQLIKRLQKQWIIKKASQPMAHQSAGCIFKNPRDSSAGQLIELCGLKGVRSGGAEVSQTHANFIIAHEDATSDDVLKLIEQVRRTVRERHEVELELEIEIW